MKLRILAASIAVIGLNGQVFAQASDAPPARVEITGSSIKRLATAGALPIQTINGDDLTKQGITNAEDALKQLAANGDGMDNGAANNNVFGDKNADGVAAGSASANLRGQGPASTLVLLNGRRMATHGTSGVAVDVNTIPMAAIERIEVLKDGASAIYGTDAIGGVINFILKRDYQGVEVGSSLNFTEGGGGAQRRFTLLAGKGSLAQDGYNVMLSVAHDNNDILRGTDRDFATSWRPEVGLSPDSTSSRHANIRGGTGVSLPSTGSTVTVNGVTSTIKYTAISDQALQGKCDSLEGFRASMPEHWTAGMTEAGNRYRCSTEYGKAYMLAAPNDRTNVYGRGLFKINENHTAFAELAASRTKNTAILTPNQVNTVAATHYPVNGPHYLDLRPFGVTTYDVTKPISMRWRLSDWGNRTQENISENSRVVVGAEGTIASNYDYKISYSNAESKAHTNLIDGYFNIIKWRTLMATGLVDPFLNAGETQTQAAIDAIEATKVRGRLHEGKSTLSQFAGTVSGELMTLPAGQVSFAVGTDIRSEEMRFDNLGNVCIISQTTTDPNAIFNCPGNANSPNYKRDIEAFYGELIVPVTKSLELQLQARTDKYSDFGRTTNPKVAFRYQPSNWLLLRGSTNTGFRAPSPRQLAQGATEGLLTQPIDDPMKCPTGTPNQDTTPGCNLDDMEFTDGGNPNLAPEKSRQATIGFVAAPVPSLTVYADYWQINVRERIRYNDVDTVLGNYEQFPENLVRDASGNLIQIRSGFINAGETKDAGIDLGARWTTKLDGAVISAGIDGTYLLKHEERELATLPLTDKIGKWITGGNIYLRWKHVASLSYAKGNWSTTLSQLYKSGYDQEDVATEYGNTFPNLPSKVKSYTTYDLSASYSGLKNVKLTAGIQNLLDTDPPFSIHSVDYLSSAGWDARVANPRGRSVFVNANYKF